MAGAAIYGAFEQPLPNAIFGETADFTNLVQQGRSVHGIPKPVAMLSVPPLLPPNPVVELSMQVEM